jgi:hypothetical protein
VNWDPHPGYGLSLIRDLIPHELGGTVDLTFPSDGMCCKIEIPSGEGEARTPGLARRSRSNQSLTGIDPLRGRVHEDASVRLHPHYLFGTSTRPALQIWLGSCRNGNRRPNRPQRRARGRPSMILPSARTEKSSFFGHRRRPRLYHVDGKGKHDGRTALSCNVEERCKIAQLHGLRRRREDVGGLH